MVPMKAIIGRRAKSIGATMAAGASRVTHRAAENSKVNSCAKGMRVIAKNHRF